jgi:hypothetical protein
VSLRRDRKVKKHASPSNTLNPNRGWSLAVACEPFYPDGRQYQIDLERSRGDWSGVVAPQRFWIVPFHLANSGWLRNEQNKCATHQVEASRSGSKCTLKDECTAIRNGGNIVKKFGMIGASALFLLMGMSAPANARQEKQEEKAKPQKQEQQAKPEKQQQAPKQQPQHQQQAPKQQPQHQQQAQAPKQQPQHQQQAQASKQQPQHQQQAQAPKQQPQHQQQAQAPKQQQQHQQQQAQAPKQQQHQQQQAQVSKQQQQQAQGHQGQQQQSRQQQSSRTSRAPERTQQAQERQRSQPALRLSARGSGRIPDQRFRSNFGREHRFRINEPVLVGGYSRFQYGGYWFGFVEPWPAGWYYTDDVYIDYVDGGYYMYDPYYPGARFSISVVI